MNLCEGLPIAWRHLMTTDNSNSGHFLRDVTMLLPRLSLVALILQLYSALIKLAFTVYTMKSGYKEL